MRRVAERFFPLFLFVAALLARAPTLDLPLEGESAVLASVADHLGHERGWELAGRAPLVPLLGAMLVASGLPATAAVRWIEVLAAALLALLAVRVGRGLGLARSSARLAGLLTALHPLALAYGGGLAPGTLAAGTTLLLASLAGLMSQRVVVRRVGAACALLLPLTDPVSALYLPALLLGFTRRESSAPWERGLLVIGTALLVVGPGALPALASSLGGAGIPAAAAVCGWLLAAGLLVLCIGWPRGFGRIWQAEGEERLLRRAWLVTAAVHVLLLAGLGQPQATLPWRMVTPALPLLPLLVVAGVAGLAARAERWAPRLLRGALVCAVLGSTWTIWGGLQVALSPGAPGPAGRLHLLRRAVRTAAEEAADNKWIVLAVADGRHAEQTSLADLNPDHWTWSHREAAAPGAGPGLRQLRPFPAAAFESGQAVIVVAEAGASGAVHTFGGAGIFHQTVLQQVGPYVVLRARRPR